MKSQKEFDAGDLRIAAVIIVAAVLVLFLVRQTGYPILTRHDERVGAYVLDAVQNGNWIIQKDSTGEIAAKPPLLTWCAAIVTLLTGRITQFAIHLPAAVSLAAAALVMLVAGGQFLGWRAGFFAACAYVISPAGASQLATARYDGLLALMVILTALAAFRAWFMGSGWTWFWLAAAFGTMAKGPLAVLLGATGLLAAAWEWHSRSPAPFRGNHLAGILLFLMICGGWFALACGELGQPLIDKMIGRELVGHALGSADETSPLDIFKPPVDFLLGFAPWCLLTLYAIWRNWRRPDSDVAIRRFERFLICGFLIGLTIFCLAGHQKGRLIVPLMPFAALLAGRELAEITLPWSNLRVFRTVIVLVCLFAIGVFLHAHFVLGCSSRVRETLGAQEVVQLIVQRLGANAPLTHADSPFAVQFYLNSVRPTVSFERAAALLQGDDAAWVMVGKFANLEKALGADAKPLHEVVRWPETGEPRIRVVGNQPLPITNQSVAILLGPLRVETHSLRLEHPRLSYRRGMELSFCGDATQGVVRIENQGETLQRVRVRVFDETSRVVPREFEANLPPSGTWNLPGHERTAR